MPNRISADANSSRASLKLYSSRGGEKYDADDSPLPTQNRDNFLFWLIKKGEKSRQDSLQRNGILTKSLSA